MPISKLKNKIFTYKGLAANWEKYAYTFCVLKYYNYIYLYHIQPGSYPTDRGYVRRTNSFRDYIEHNGLSNTLVTWIVFNKETFMTISENRNILQVMFMDYKTWTFWVENSMYITNKFSSKKVLKNW